MVKTNKRLMIEMVGDPTIGAQSGRVFRPKLLDSGNWVAHLKGYHLSAGLGAGSVIEERHNVNLHMGSKIQAFDSLPEPNIELARFSWLSKSATIADKEEQRLPWVSCDLVLPYLFFGFAVSSSDSASDVVVHGTLEYEYIKVSDVELLELFLMWELDSSVFHGKSGSDALRPSLERSTTRGAGLTPPFFLINSSDEG